MFSWFKWHSSYESYSLNRQKGGYFTRRIWACTQALVTGSSDHYLHTIFTLIKTITKSSNVNGWSNMTVDTSCLCKWTVSDVVAHFAVLIVFFLMKTYNWCPFSYSNFVIVLTNWKQEFKSSNSICNHTCNYQIWLPLRGLPISIITRMIQTELDSTQSYYHYLLHMCKLHKES